MATPEEATLDAILDTVRTKLRDQQQLYQERLEMAKIGLQFALAALEAHKDCPGCGKLVGRIKAILDDISS
jgi:hypothetical protein